MSQFSQKAEKLISSEIVRLGNIISERVRSGAQIYNYTIGDVDPAIFPIPAEFKACIIDAYNNDFTNYQSAEGIIELRQSISSFVKQYQGLDYAVNEIQVASGGRPLIYSLFATLVDPGDKVIYAVPSWNNNHYTNINLGEHCCIEALPENNFMPCAADIKPHLAGAVLLCLCTPQNPTGTTLGKKDLEEICDLIIEENKKRAASGQRLLYVMYDQIYSLLTYGDTHHHDPVSVRPAMKEFTVFVDGISKVFAATGVRVGWSLGPAAVIGKMKALLSHIGAWAPMAEQKATAAYLVQTAAIDRYLDQYKKELDYRLQTFFEGLTTLKQEGFPVDVITPQAAIYLTIKIDLAGKKNGDKTLENQEEVTAYLLDEARIAVVPFYAFGADRQSPWYRLSVGTCAKDDIPKVMASLKAALNKLS